MANNFNKLINELMEMEDQKDNKRTKEEIAADLEIDPKTLLHWRTKEANYHINDKKLASISKCFNVSKHELQKALDGKKHDLRIPPEAEEVSLNLANKELLMNMLTENYLVLINTAMKRNYKMDTEILKTGHRVDKNGKDYEYQVRKSIGLVIKNQITANLNSIISDFGGNSDEYAAYSDDEIKYLSKYSDDSFEQIETKRLSFMRQNDISTSDIFYAYRIWEPLFQSYNLKTGLGLDSLSALITMMKDELFDEVCKKIKKTGNMKKAYEEWCDKAAE